MTPLPSAFEAQMQDLLAADYPTFAEVLETPPPVSLHYNPRKPMLPLVASATVPWYERGVYLAERPSFTLDPCFHAGAYYVQEASSMLIAAAVARCFPEPRPLRVLDLCAAPGGKSTLLASILPPGSWLLANEVIRTRYQVLRYNLTKWGYDNTFSSNHDVADFVGLAGFFDLVLVDAPCSGEGLFRKDLNARSEWSPEHVQLCTARQGRILDVARELVAPGGILLYSTCTYNRSENDTNAAVLAADPALTHEPLDFPAAWGLAPRTHGQQAYPHRLAGEGFYLAAFRKAPSARSFQGISSAFHRLTPVPKKDQAAADAWATPEANLQYYVTPSNNWRALATPLVADAQILANHLHRLEVGTLLGEWKGQQLIPSSNWALATASNPNLPAVEVDAETALDFLRKGTPPIPELPRGWTIVRHQGLNLGWAKGLGNRYNNYYPKHWRIRMQ
ncbi:MAG: RNA methyltransferase [Bacteroidetes bacterium]|nr:MAG: RNA methyltransferase [Bacteroidota bacterium]PTM11200.1 MAG: RNA methyltransferase [Bacteroidota bacterium]